MEKTIFVLFAISAVLALAGCSQASPQATGPTAQASDAEAVDPWQIVRNIEIEHSVYYAGFLDDSFGLTVGYDGEIHYTDDGGVTWPQADNESWCRFGLEIVDSQVAWHCGNGGHVRTSTDAGRTWQPVSNFGPNEPDHCRFLSFLDAQTGWAATPYQLALTTDGGNTWMDLSLPEGIQTILAIDLLTPSRGYLLDENGRLYVTSDGGTTWTSQQLNFASDALLIKISSPGAVVRFMDEERGVIVLPRGNTTDGFYLWSAYTEDGGDTWKHDQLPLDKGVYNLYLSRDGTVLTAFDSSHRKMTVLQFQQP